MEILNFSEEEYVHESHDTFTRDEVRPKGIELV